MENSLCGGLGMLGGCWQGRGRSREARCSVPCGVRKYWWPLASGEQQKVLNSLAPMAPSLRGGRVRLARCQSGSPCLAAKAPIFLAKPGECSLHEIGKGWSF